MMMDALNQAGPQAAPAPSPEMSTPIQQFGRGQPQEPDIMAGIEMLVADAMKRDPKAMEVLQGIVQAAQSGDQDAIALRQVIGQTVAAMRGQAKGSGAPAPKQPMASEAAMPNQMQGGAMPDEFGQALASYRSTVRMMDTDGDGIPDTPMMEVPQNMMAASR